MHFVIKQILLWQVLFLLLKLLLKWHTVVNGACLMLLVYIDIYITVIA